MQFLEKVLYHVTISGHRMPIESRCSLTRFNRIPLTISGRKKIIRPLDLGKHSRVLVSILSRLSHQLKWSENSSKLYRVLRSQNRF